MKQVKKFKYFPCKFKSNNNVHILMIANLQLQHLLLKIYYYIKFYNIQNLFKVKI